MTYYDIKMYNKDGLEGPTVRGLTYAQQYALMVVLEEHNIKHIVKPTSDPTHEYPNEYQEGCEVYGEDFKEV